MKNLSKKSKVIVESLQKDTEPAPISDEMRGFLHNAVRQRILDEQRAAGPDFAKMQKELEDDPDFKAYEARYGKGSFAKYGQQRIPTGILDDLGQLFGDPLEGPTHFEKFKEQERVRRSGTAYDPRERSAVRPVDGVEALKDAGVEALATAGGGAAGQIVAKGARALRNTTPPPSSVRPSSPRSKNQRGMVILGPDGKPFRPEAPKPKSEAPKPKSEAPKPEAPKPEAPKPEAPKPPTEIPADRPLTKAEMKQKIKDAANDPARVRKAQEKVIEAEATKRAADTAAGKSKISQEIDALKLKGQNILDKAGPVGKALRFSYNPIEKLPVVGPKIKGMSTYDKFVTVPARVYGAAELVQGFPTLNRLGTMVDPQATQDEKEKAKQEIKNRISNFYSATTPFGILGKTFNVASGGAIPTPAELIGDVGTQALVDLRQASAGFDRAAAERINSVSTERTQPQTQPETGSSETNTTRPNFPSYEEWKRGIPSGYNDSRQSYNRARGRYEGRS